MVPTLRCPLWRPTSLRAKLHLAWRSRCSSQSSPSQCRAAEVMIWMMPMVGYVLLHIVTYQQNDLSLCIYIYIHIYMYRVYRILMWQKICMYVCIYLYMYKYIYIYLYIYSHSTQNVTWCIYIYMNDYIHIWF